MYTTVLLGCHCRDNIQQLVSAVRSGTRGRYRSINQSVCDQSPAPFLFSLLLLFAGSSASRAGGAPRRVQPAGGAPRRIQQAGGETSLKYQNM